jgi:hypothetical protein
MQHRCFGELRRLSAVPEDRVPQLLKLSPDVGGHLPVSLRGRRYAEGSEQGRGRLARVARLAENRVQAVRSQVVEHHVDDGPWIVGFMLMVVG